MTQKLTGDIGPESSVLDNDSLESETGLTADDSTDIYPSAEVRISRVQYSLLHLKRLFEERKELIIDPEFQRNSVWEARQRSELIESILMGIPLPVIYLFESKDGRKQVVDGRQRITAIIDYLNDKIRLSDLKILRNLNGLTFTQLEPKLQGIVEDSQILAYVIQPPTAERVKYDIFDRVNRGGTTLNAQEMRNALYGGPATALINRICTSDAFITATDQGISPTRMRDRYVVLRVLAFVNLLSGDLSQRYEYKSDIDDFLAWYMTMLNRTLSPEAIDELSQRYISLFSRIHSIVGKDAFRFKSATGKRRPVNMPLVESVAYLFSRVGEITDKRKFRSSYNAWKKQMDNSGLFKRNVDSSTSVNARRDEVDNFIKSLS